MGLGTGYKTFPMKKTDNLLIVFIKYPRPGFVKTRLSRHIGNERAAEVYKRTAEIVLTNTTFSESAKKTYDITIWFTPLDDEQCIQRWLNFNGPLLPQEGNDLGARMVHALQRGFDDGYKHVIIIGSDCPYISQTIITMSFAELDKNDVVLGPAYDGGYYLIGMKKPIPDVFQDIDWSTDKVLHQTLDQLDSLHVAYAFLPVLRDIDTIEDLHYYARRGINL
jgi:uncharacterized protein